jgi:hypothetical protein
MTHEISAELVHLPPDDNRALTDYNQLLQEAGGDVTDQQRRYDEMVETARAEIDDAYELHLFNLTANIERWFHWGQRGDPLPAGLKIVENKNGTAEVEFDYPLNQEIEVRTLDRLRKYGLSDLSNEINDNQLRAIQEVIRPASREIIRGQGGVSELFEVILGTDIEPGHDSSSPDDDLIRRSMARRLAQTSWGADPIGSPAGSPERFMKKETEPESGEWEYVLDNTYQSRKLQSKATFMRLTEFADDPPAKEDTSMLTMEEFQQTQAKIFNWLDRETGGRATGVIAAAQQHYRENPRQASPMNDQEYPRSARDELWELISEVLKKHSHDPNYISNEVKSIFVGTLNEFIYLPAHDEVYPNNHSVHNYILRHGSWESFLEHQITGSMTAYPYYRPYACMGIGLGQPRSANTLAFLRAPLPRPGDIESSATNGGIVKVPTAPRPTLSGGSVRDTNNMIYQNIRDEERMSSTTYADVEIWSGFNAPPDRRLIWQIPRGEDELPPYSSETNDAVAMITLRPGVLAEGRVPHIPGYKLVAQEGEQFYFTYDASSDPYRNDLKLEAEHQTAIIEACKAMGMNELAAEVERRRTLSAKTLSRLVQKYSYQSYPSDEVLPVGNALIAPAVTEEDFKVFVDKGGRFCGQCSGGAQLFQFLIKKGIDGYAVSSIGGSTWDAGNKTISAVPHRQTRIKTGFGKECIIDTSLMKDGSMFSMEAKQPIRELPSVEQARKEAEVAAIALATGNVALGDTLDRDAGSKSPTLDRATLQEIEDRDPIEYIDSLLEELKAKLMKTPRNAEEALKQPTFETLILSLSPEDPIRRGVEFLYQTKLIHNAKRRGDPLPVELNSYDEGFVRLKRFLETIYDNQHDSSGLGFLREISASSGIPYIRYATSGNIVRVGRAVIKARYTL